jgi:hypothetical protein
MKINGTGITEFEAKILQDYQPLQRHSITWTQLSSGNWKASDRGTAADSYESKISLYGRESVINTFIEQINANRIAGSYQIVMSDFSETEKIFGHNITHTSITATIMDIPKRRQGSFKGWGLADVYVKFIGTPTFTGATTMPTLVNCEFGGEADSDYTITKKESYTNAMTYQDKESDSGIFEGVFTLKNADFVSMLNYIRVARSGNMTLADTFGVDYPFGSRSTDSYPYTVKLIEWEDMGYFGLLYRKLRLRFAEVI